ncbi:hypothetical protein [Planotetraspora phitsanulokensis]|nr:hypothetical protein [Planotetraspora phitsanulokensis]
MSTKSSLQMPSVLTRTLRVPLWTSGLALALGLMIGAATATFGASDRGVPRVVQGTITAVNSDGTAIGFTEDGSDREGEGILVAGDSWTDRKGANFGGTPPTCLAPGSYGQRVELAILDLQGHGNWPDKLVVWVHCLS